MFGFRAVVLSIMIVPAICDCYVRESIDTSLV